MRIVISALGSFGDVHPMIGLGKTLKERGHVVKVLANPYFQEPIEQAGLLLEPLGSREDYLELLAIPELWHPVKGISVVFQHACQRHLATLYDVVEGEVAAGVDRLVAHGLDFASRVAGEKYGIPVIGTNFAPQVFWSLHTSPRMPGAMTSSWVPRWLRQLQFSIGEKLVLERLAWKPVRQLRAKVGLPDRGGSFVDWWHDCSTNLGLFPDWFAPPQPDWPRRVELTGFPLWDGGVPGQIDRELKSFLDDQERPLVFTPGSANRWAKSFFATAASTCASLGRAGILLTRYAEQIPENLPANVRWFGFVPLSQVLPRCGAFIHHGGIGSCAQGLATGVPQLIRPQGFDQFDNSIRLIRLGVGAELKERHFSERRLCDTLEGLWASPQLEERCAELRQRCDGPMARQRAAEVIEQASE